MSATTLPKRQPRNPSGGKAMPKHYTYLIIGGIVFVAAWAVWNFWLGAAIPR
jgi:hypothetical protein